MFKSAFALLLFSFSLANARSVSFVCSDETVAYDTQALKSLEWSFISNIVAGHRARQTRVTQANFDQALAAIKSAEDQKKNTYIIPKR